MAYPHVLLSLFRRFRIALALRSPDRIVWLAENSLTVITVATLRAIDRRWPLVNLAIPLPRVSRATYNRWLFPLCSRTVRPNGVSAIQT